MNRKIAVIVGLLIMGLSPVLAIPIGTGVELIPSPRNLGVNIETPSQKLTVNGAMAIVSFASAPTVLASQPTIYVQNDQLFYKSPIHTTAFRIDVADSTGSTITNATIINPTIGGTVTFQNTADILPFTVNGTINADLFNGGMFKGNGSLLTGVVASALKAPDGSPNPAVQVDNTGNVTVTTGNNLLLKASSGTPNDPGDISFTTFSNTQKARIYSEPTAGVNKLYLVAGTDNTPDLTVIENGDVGIGTINPTAELEVIGLVKATKFSGDGSLLTGINATTINNNSINSSNISNGSIQTVDLANNSITSAKIANGTITTVDIDPNFRPSGLRAPDGSPDPAVIVDNIGLVGVGLTNPNTQLEVNGAVAVRSTNPNFSLVETDVADQNWDVHLNSGKFIIREVNDARDTFNERLVIKATDGNVGIGISTPLFKLDVTAGDFAAAGATIVGSNNLTLKGGGASPQDPGDVIFTNNSLVQKARIFADANSGVNQLYLTAGADTTPDISIKEDGNVGIGMGASTAIEKLQVIGNAKAFNFIGNGTGLKNIPLNAINTIGTKLQPVTINGAINASLFNGGIFKGDGTQLTGVVPTMLKAPDGSPNPALWIDNTGNTVITADSATANDPGDIIFTTFNNTSQKARIFADPNAAVNKLHFLAGGDTTPDLTIIENGDVGIGTMTPTAELEVIGLIKATKFSGDGSLLTGIIPSALKAPDGTPNPALNIDNNGNAIFSGFIKLNNFTNGILLGSDNTTPIPTTDGFRIRRNNNFFGTLGADALVIEKTDGNAVDPDGGIVFSNTGNDGVVEAAMTIRGTGNVGIGTTSPTAKLQVAGITKVSDGFDLVLQASPTTTGDAGDLVFKTGNNVQKARIFTDANAGVNQLYFLAGSDTTPDISVKEDGNVGIGMGTSTATEKLQVIGNAKAFNFIGNGTGLKNIPLDAINTIGTKLQPVTVNGAINATLFNGGVFKGDGSQLTNIVPSALQAPDGSPNPAVQVDNVGNVGIGTSTPLESKLHLVSAATRVTIQHTNEGMWSEFATAGVTSTNQFVKKWSVGSTGDTRGAGFGGGNKFYVFQYTDKNDIAVNGYRMVIDSNGNMGIGTTNPSTKLQVIGTVKATDFAGDGSGLTNIPGNQITGTVPATAIDPNFRPSALKSPDGSPNPALNIDNNGNALFSGFIKLGNFTDAVLLGTDNTTPIPTTDGFRIKRDNTFFGASGIDAIIIDKTDGNAPDPDGGIVFTNTGNDGVIEAAMSIRGTGNVGIGTTSPMAKLQVAGLTKVSNGFDFVLQADSANPGDPGDLVFTTSNNVQKARLYTDPSTNDLYIAAGTTNTADVTFKDDGNVGIGTATPSQKLEVIGSVKAFNFIGNGTGLKNIPLNAINTVGTKLQPVTVNGAINASLFNGGVFKGNGSQLTGIVPSALKAPDGSPNPAVQVINDGNVGIGTITPAAKLEVAGSIIAVGATISQGNDLLLKASSADPLNAGDLVFVNNNGTQKTRIWTGTTAGTESLYFAVGSDIGPDMAITAAGNVGIGTISPEAGLNVTNNSIRVSGSDGGFNTGATTAFLDYEIPTRSARIGQLRGASGTKGSLRFVSNSTVNMILNGNGDVGIGNISPQAKLDVAGSLLSGTSYLTTQLAISSTPNLTVTWSSANRQVLLLTSNVTNMTFAGLASTVVGSVVLEVRQDGAGGRTITNWLAPIRWPGGYCPPLSTTPNAIDVVSCVWDGTYYLCQLSKDFKAQGT